MVEVGCAFPILRYLFSEVYYRGSPRDKRGRGGERITAYGRDDNDDDDLETRDCEKCEEVDMS